MEAFKTSLNYLRACICILRQFVFIIILNVRAKTLLPPVKQTGNASIVIKNRKENALEKQLGFLFV